MNDEYQKYADEITEYNRRVAMARLEAARKIMEILVSKELIGVLNDVSRARDLQLEVLSAVKSIV